MKPWDIPPLPTQGDKSADLTYAAVGRAMSQWEELELYLARLYATFIGKPPIEAISELAYKNAALFRDRAKVIEEAAETHFIAHPDQALEGEFKELICDVRHLSNRRNDIAHGIVRLIWIGETNAETLEEALIRNEYMLTPATYRAKMFDAALTPTYLLSSIEINRFTAHFEQVRLTRVEPLLVRVQQQRGPLPDIPLPQCP